MKNLTKLSFIACSIFILTCIGKTEIKINVNSIIQDLKNRKISHSKNIREGESIQLSFLLDSNVDGFNLANVCPSFKIKSLVFEKNIFNDSFFLNADRCDFSDFKSLSIYGSNIDFVRACFFFSKSRSSSKLLSILNTSIPKNIANCFASSVSINEFAIDNPKDFSG